MQKKELTTLAIRLGERARMLDNLFGINQISKEHYITERNAIDVVVSYLADDIGYTPRDYKHYSDVICAMEVNKRIAETEARLKKVLENKAKSSADAEGIIQAFMFGVKSGESIRAFRAT